MALRPYPGFIGPSYTSESKIAAYDRTVNWYPEQIESGTGNTAARYVLYPTPGNFEIPSASSALTTPGRGGWSLRDFGAYYIVGDTLYRLYPGTPAAVATGISNISNAPVYFASNGDTGRQLLIASDDTTYAYDLDSEVLTEVGTESAVSIGYVDGYGIRLDSVRSEISVSAPFDFTVWNALDVSQRNDAPDKWLRLLVNHKELWLFGSDTSSVWYNAGDEGVAGPFAPIPSVFIPYGIAAPHSAVVVDGSPIWLGGTPNGSCIVYKAEGYTPVRISTHAVENAFREIFGAALTVSNADASTYQENGHIFYVLTFPANLDTDFAGATWVYDATSGLWHERGVWNGLTFGCIDTIGNVQSNVQFTLSRTSGKVYLQSISLSVGTDGLGIVRLRRAPHINQAQQRIRYRQFRALMETGIGLGDVVSTDPAFDPQITLAWSNDGGQTFGSPIPMSAGTIGAYSTLVDWFQLEQAQDRIFEVRCSAAVSYRLIAAFLDYSVGPS